MDETYHQKVMVESHRGSFGDLQDEKVQTPSTFSNWKTNFETEKVSSGLGHPKEATPWIKEIELANSVDEFETSQSVTGNFDFC